MVRNGLLKPVMFSCFAVAAVNVCCLLIATTATAVTTSIGIYYTVFFLSIDPFCLLLERVVLVALVSAKRRFVSGWCSEYFRWNTGCGGESAALGAYGA